MDKTELNLSKESFMTKKSLRKGILAIVLSAVMAAMSACGGSAGTANKTAQAVDTTDSVSAEAAESGNGTDAANISGTNSASSTGTDITSASAGTATVNLRYSAITSDLTTFKSGDMYERWTAGKSVLVKADGENVEIDEDAVGITCDGTDISVTLPGTYVFEGNLNGTLTVNVSEKAKVRLILNGFEITSSDGPAIRILEGDRVTISLEDDTENVVTDSETYSDETLSSAIYSKSDLIFNGNGKLKVNANHADAIASKDDLRIVSGEYVINAVDDGIVGKDRLKIKDGKFTVTSGGDALKTTNIEKVDRGFIYIANGTFKLTSGDEAMDATSSIRIDDGDFTVLTGEGSANAAHSTQQGFGSQGGPGGMEFGHGGFPGDMPDDSDPMTYSTIRNPEEMAGNALSGGFMKLSSEESQTDDTSGLSEEEAATADAMADEFDDTDTVDTIATAKGFKCEGVLEIRGGSFVIDAEDDALNGGYQVIISGGTLTIRAGDDGIHADDTIDISDGEITIENSYEGLEAVNINISGGNTSVTATDDGVNASGGMNSSTIASGTNAGASGSDKSSEGTASGSTDTDASGSDKPAEGETSGSTDTDASGSDKTAEGATSGSTDADASGSDKPAEGAASGSTDADASGSDKPAEGAASGSSDTGDAGDNKPAGGPGMSGDGSGPAGNPNGMRGMGGMFEESSGYLTITGGKLYVNSGGDGLDANTDIKQTGGEVIVEGPTDNGNGSLDYGNSYKMNGGTLTATGSSGMLQSISEESKSYAVTVLFTDNVAVGTTISLRKSNGKEIASITITKVTETFQFAGKGLKKGGTYTLYCDDEEICTITLTGKVTTVDDSGTETSVSRMMMGGGHVRS